ncbi:MAG: hypothetical protein HQL40_17525 [Alphaproteobacteria bacterium]|nr:hypothetical protein [Alphaproteobacteria bacterium]MBF0335417.1 hypothetical protein [Alphaproteobacteria bacterium]
MGSTTYTIQVSLAAATLTALLNSGYVLYCFLATQCSDKAGRPTVMWQTAALSPLIQVGLTTSQCAFTASAPMPVGGQIAPAYSAAVAIGECFVVEAGGVGTVQSGAPPGTVAIINDTTTPFTCGLATDTGPIPFCAMPLYGNAMQILVPTSTALLMFTTVNLPPGTAVSRSYGPAVLIDMAAADQTPIPVSFDVNTGWSWGGFPWATAVASNADLLPLLLPPLEIQYAQAASLFGAERPRFKSEPAPRPPPSPCRPVA